MSEGIKLFKDYSQIINKGNALIEMSYGDGFRAFDHRLIFLMMTQLDSQRDSEFKLQRMTVSEAVAKLHADPSHFYRDVKKFERVYNELKIIDKSNNSSFTSEEHKQGFRSMVVLTNFNFIPASESEDNNAYIEWKFNETLKPYLLEIDGKKTPYTELMLDHLKRLCVKHAFRLYELLKQHYKLKERLIPIHKLREYLGLEEAYKTYGELKKKVIIPSVKDINRYTDIFITVREEKQGRKVIAVKFFIFPNEAFKQYLNDEHVIEAEPVTTGFQNENDFLQKITEKFHAHRELKFRRKWGRLSKKRRQELIDLFLESSNSFTRKEFERLGLESSAMMAMFISEMKNYLYKREADYDLFAYSKSLGYELVRDEEGRTRLKHGVLTER